MAQDSKNDRRKLRESTLKSLNGLAKDVGSEPVQLRSGNETLAEVFKTFSRKVTAEKLERLEELCVVCVCV